MVEKIKKLNSPLKTKGLSDNNIFQKGKIGIGIPWPTEEIALFIPIRSERRNWELRCRDYSCTDVCLPACCVLIPIGRSIGKVIVISVSVIVSTARLESIYLIAGVEGRLKRCGGIDRKWVATLQDDRS